MLRINRVKIEISTINGVYGYDTPFADGLNFLSSEENTCGKSSILAAIYYCLGFEEIIGGRGDKVLTSVYKNLIEDDGKTWNVQESHAYLEISNGEEIVTLYRTGKSQERDSRMISVYYGNIDSVSNPHVKKVDMYVHFPNSAVNEKGFHNFLESFLHLKLPLVTASDDSQRKLYLQLIFSCMFIEQKHGWSDLFSGMPILGIKESKKRVIEFVLNLDTLANEKAKEKLKSEEATIVREWTDCYNELSIAANRESCTVINFPIRPQIMNEVDIARITIKNQDSLIVDTVNDIERQIKSLKQLKPKIIDNFEELQNELKKAETNIVTFDNHINNCRKQLQGEKCSIAAIKNNLEIIATDLINNKDAARLKKLGSEMQCCTSNGICPVCHQPITDSLLPLPNDIPVMSIDENIRHLEAQKKMLNFALNSHQQHKAEIEKEIRRIEPRIFTLRRFAQSLRNDLFSVNDDYSEAIVYKKITLEKQIDALNTLNALLEEKQKDIKELSQKWNNCLNRQKEIPKNKFTDLDNKKLKALRTNFIGNLELFGYKSIANLNNITISNESYLPLFEGFDMKFDSSASDNIRVIWAFTMALQQVSQALHGNHPTVLIFDEPDQQSTIVSDMKAFFKSIVAMKDQCQVIIGITLKDTDTKKVIQELPEKSYKRIDIPNKAFALMTGKTI